MMATSLKLWTGTKIVRDCHLQPRGGKCLPTALEARDDGADESTLYEDELAPRKKKPKESLMTGGRPYLDTIGLDGNEAVRKKSRVRDHAIGIAATFPSIKLGK